MNKYPNLIDAINYRRSVRVYDEAISIETKVVKKCIELATLAPNSSNMQLWEFHHISSIEMLQKLNVACLNQNASKTAKELVVVVVRKDLWKKRTASNIKNLESIYGKKSKKEMSSREKFAFNYYGKIMPFL